MQLDLNSIATATATLALCLILKILLDLGLARKFVKHFSWLPVRNYFRSKPIRLSGKWEQYWNANSTTFNEEIDRHSNVEIKQLSSYCYGEFSSKQISYCVFGRIEDKFLLGEWYDANDKLGYFGTFQLQVIDSKTMVGIWIGHSHKRNEIKYGEWTWKRVS
jgi:hypothetical protein